MWIAELDTSNFHFTALGETEDDAVAALYRGLRQHAEDYRITNKDWYQDYEPNCYQIAVGDCLRDREALSVRGH